MQKAINFWKGGWKLNSWIMTLLRYFCFVIILLTSVSSSSPFYFLALNFPVQPTKCKQKFRILLSFLAFKLSFEKICVCLSPVSTISIFFWNNSDLTIVWVAFEFKKGPLFVYLHSVLWKIWVEKGNINKSIFRMSSSLAEKRKSRNTSINLNWLHPIGRKVIFKKLLHTRSVPRHSFVMWCFDRRRKHDGDDERRRELFGFIVKPKKIPQKLKR